MTAEWIETLLRFFERGGPALWAILAVSLWLWMRIGEGYVFVFVTHPREAREQRLDTPGAALRLSLRLGPRVRTVQSLTGVLPLLGLLGTVGGMIGAFDVLALFGSTNARGLSLGISQALLTTMAGLVTSLAGLFAAMPLVRQLREADRDAAGGEGVRDGLAVSRLLVLRARLRGRARGAVAE
jgi:biopolymer transport protein ExbB